MPRPPIGFSSMKAPACVAILPAISLIGASSGRLPVRVLDRLVGDAGRARRREPARQLRVRRQVQVGEEHLPGPQQLDLLGCGSFTLSTSSASPKTAAASGTMRAPCASNCASVERAALAGAGLHEHLVAALGRARGRPRA